MKIRDIIRIIQVNKQFVDSIQFLKQSSDFSDLYNETNRKYSEWLDTDLSEVKSGKVI